MVKHIYNKNNKKSILGGITMLRRFSALLLILLIAVFMTACGNETSTTKNEPIKISEMRDFSSYSEIYVDEETNVMYLFSKNGHGGGLTTMLNADGTPKLSEGTKYDTVKISEMGDFSSYSEIYVDEETDVMYLFSKNGYGGGLTTMLNADGTPKLSEGTKYDTVKISEMRGFGSYSEIYVDEETDVMYLFSKNEYGGGLTTMHNGEIPKTK